MEEQTRKQKAKRIWFLLLFLLVSLLVLLVLVMKSVDAFSEKELTEQNLRTEPAAVPKEPAHPLDISEVSAGTVVSAEEVDKNRLENYFRSYQITEGDAVYQRINGKSYVENPEIGLEELRYFKVLHYNFDGEIQVGELIANVALEADLKEIFQKLFQEEYRIYSMYLIDHFWSGDGSASDEASMKANNTSGFCYRTVTDGLGVSNHALGRAIDINPLQNPYVGKDASYWYPENAQEYIDRTQTGEHMITREDACYRLFSEYGFSWGGDWENIKDYQHFEKAR